MNGPLGRPVRMQPVGCEKGGKAKPASQKNKSQLYQSHHTLLFLSAWMRLVRGDAGFPALGDANYIAMRIVAARSSWVLRTIA